MGLVPKKLRPGYTFHNEITGIALQRSLPDAAGKTVVFAFNKDGGREEMPGPFFLIDEEMAKKQESKFEDPTEEEVALLKKANSKEIDIRLAPPQNPMKTISIDDKSVKLTPSDKEIKAKGEAPKPPAPSSDALSLRNNSARGKEEKKKKKK